MKLVAKFLGLSEDATEQQILDALKKRDDDAAKAAANLFVSMGEKAGLITNENKAKFDKLAQTDLSLAVEFLPTTSAPAAQADPAAAKKEEQPKLADQHTSLLEAIKALRKDESKAEDRKDWDWNRWSREDPAGLNAMIKSKPDEAVKLLNSTYGTEIGVSEIQKYKV